MYRNVVRIIFFPELSILYCMCLCLSVQLYILLIQGRVRAVATAFAFPSVSQRQIVVYLNIFATNLYIQSSNPHVSDTHSHCINLYTYDRPYVKFKLEQSQMLQLTPSKLLKTNEKTF